VLPPGEVDPQVVIYVKRRGKWEGGEKKKGTFGGSIADGISQAAMLTTIHATASAKVRFVLQKYLPQYWIYKSMG